MESRVKGTKLIYWLQTTIQTINLNFGALKSIFLADTNNKAKYGNVLFKNRAHKFHENVFWMYLIEFFAGTQVINYQFLGHEYLNETCIVVQWNRWKEPNEPEKW